MTTAPSRPPAAASHAPSRAPAPSPGASTTALRWSVPVGVLIVALALFPAYRHGVGLDGLSYLAIAESYAAGSWDAAVNAYWSPLYSWLHVPLLALGVAPLDAATVVAAFVAAGVLLALGRLLRASGASEQSSWMVSLALAVPVLAWAHYGVFADLLLAALLLAALAALVDPRFPTRRALPLQAGALLGLAYLTKLYALPFAAVVLPAVGLLHVLAGGVRPARAARAVAVAAAAFLAVALPWVLVLSTAEGTPTVGTAASHNLELVSPDSQGNPIFYAGLLPPARDGAYSAWEDPAAMPVEAAGWDGSSEQTTPDRVAQNLRRNAASGWAALTEQGAALLLAGVLGALAWLAGERRAPVGILGAGVAAGVYAGGYLLTWVEPRYAWLLLLLLAVPTARLLDRIAASRAGSGGALLAALLLALALLPAAVDELVLKWGSGRELAGIITAVEEEALIEPGARVASGDNWQRSAILCFQLDCTYLGLPAAQDAAGQVAELREHEVTRHLLWSTSVEPPEELSRLAGPDDLGGLRVYAGPADR